MVVGILERWKTTRQALKSEDREDRHSAELNRNRCRQRKEE
jgi:hypothetical protein